MAKKSRVYPTCENRHEFNDQRVTQQRDPGRQTVPLRYRKRRLSHRRRGRYLDRCRPALRRFRALVPRDVPERVAGRRDPDRHRYGGRDGRRGLRADPGAVFAGAWQSRGDQRLRHQSGPDGGLLSAVVDRRDRAVSSQPDHANDPVQRQWHGDGDASHGDERQPAECRHVELFTGRDQRDQHVPERRRQQRRHPGRLQRAKGNLGPGPGEGGRDAERRLQRHRQRRHPEHLDGGTDRLSRGVPFALIGFAAAVADRHQRRRPDHLRHLELFNVALRDVRRSRLHVREPDRGERHRDGQPAQSLGLR